MPAKAIGTHNRRVRQESLRELLAKQGHVQHVIELLTKVENGTTELEIPAVKLIVDTKLKLIGKYLPDLKAVEHTGEGGESLVDKILDEMKGKNTGLPKPSDES